MDLNEMNLDNPIMKRFFAYVKHLENGKIDLEMIKKLNERRFDSERDLKDGEIININE